MNTTNWRIAEQSKLKLRKALLVVMEQYDFKEITVTQITQEAKLSRKTFYRLFSSKEEIIQSFFESTFQEYFELIKAHQVQHYWDVVQLYFDFWEERNNLLSLLKKNNLLPLLFECLYQHSFDIFELIRSKETMSSFSPILPYMLAYSIGGMYSILLKWAENDMSIPSSLLVEKMQLGYKSPDL